MLEISMEMIEYLRISWSSTIAAFTFGLFTFNAIAFSLRAFEAIAFSALAHQGGFGSWFDIALEFCSPAG